MAPDSGASKARGSGGSAAGPVAAVVVVAVAFAWLLLLVLDLRDDDGAGPTIALLGIPALASSVIVQIVMSRAGGRRPGAAVLWWSLAVLPAGILVGFVGALFREPEYFIGDTGPWMLVWIPLLVVVGLLLGAPVWFFAVFPLAMLPRAIRSVVRREARPTALVLPLVLLSLGVLCVVGGLSIDTDRTGRASWGAIIASFLGLPGAYDVVWEPGLWIVRGIVAGILLVTVVPALLRRLRGRRDAGGAGRADDSRMPPPPSQDPPRRPA